jgi:hypothetical protein
VPASELVLRLLVGQCSRIQLGKQRGVLQASTPNIVREGHQRIKLVLGDGHLDVLLYASLEPL